MNKILLFLFALMLPVLGQTNPTAVTVQNGNVSNTGTVNFNLATTQFQLNGVTPSASVAAAFGNAVVGSGSSLVGGSTDSNLDLILAATGSSTSSIILNANDSVQAPNLLVPVGPAGNIICYGDSLTAGFGATTLPTVNFPFTGAIYSYPDDFAGSPLASTMQVLNLGIAAQTTANGLNQYNAGSGTTTISTFGTVTGTVTGSTTGMSGTMAVYATNGDIPYGTTATFSGTTLTFSQAATGTHTGVTLFFGTATSYGGSTVFSTNAHVISQAATGTATWFFDAYGTNDYYVGGITATGATVAASGTLTSLSVVSGSSVGGAAISSSLNGYEVWGGTGNGQGSDFTDLGTFTFTTSGTGTYSNAAAGVNSMVTFKFTPQQTTWKTNYQSLVNLAVADGDQVMVCTLFPFIYTSAGYNQGQYDEVRLLDNAWLRSTYSPNGAVAGVTLADCANIPQLQFTGNAFYQKFRNQTGSNPHLNNAGYQRLASYVKQQFAINYVSSMAGVIDITMRGGVTPGMLPVTIPQTNFTYTFTAPQQFGSLGGGGGITTTFFGNMLLSGNNGGGPASPTFTIGTVSGQGSNFVMTGGATGTATISMTAGGVLGIKINQSGASLNWPTTAFGSLQWTGTNFGVQSNVVQLDDADINNPKMVLGGNTTSTQWTIRNNVGTNRLQFGYGATPTIEVYFDNAGNINVASGATVTGTITNTTLSSGGLVASTSGSLTLATAAQKTTPSGNTATPTVVYGAGANTPTATSIVGNGQSGSITFTTGAAPATAGTVLTATFGSSFAYPTGCTCVIYPGNGSAALLSGTSMLYSAGSTTTFVLTSGSVALSGLTTYTLNYQVQGY